LLVKIIPNPVISFIQNILQLCWAKKMAASVLMKPLIAKIKNESD